MPIEERAELAARAFIRHHLTDYEAQLVEPNPFESGLDDSEYRHIKRRANDAVNDFLVAHRRPR